LLREQGIPVVAVDRRVRDGDIDAVLGDNVRGAREAVAHLIENGYRRIGIVTGLQTVTTGRERLIGYHQALQDAGLPREPELERCGTFTEASGLQLTRELLALRNPIDALFVANNFATLGALEALHEAGLRTPDDLGLVAYDGMPWSAISAVSLTTVMQPIYELGSTAAMRLLQRMQHSEPLTRQEIVLAPQLMVRASSRRRAPLEDLLRLQDLGDAAGSSPLGG
jgi:DNA-binding LacI/PurR family transcriptional regulator